MGHAYFDMKCFEHEVVSCLSSAHPIKELKPCGKKKNVRDSKGRNVFLIEATEYGLMLLK